jgi:hypothetical protein
MRSILARRRAIRQAMAELAEVQIAFIDYVFGGTPLVKESLTTIKDRIQAMRENGSVDWPTILEALDILTDALIAAQPHGPSAPDSPTEKEQADEPTTH